MEILLGLLGLGLGYLIHLSITSRNLKASEARSQGLLKEAEREISQRRKELELEVKESLIKQRGDFERETREERRQLQVLEQRLNQRESNLDRKLNLVDKKETDLNQREKTLADQEKKVADRQTELDGVLEEEKRRLSQVAGLSQDEARRILIARMEDDARHEAALRIKRIEEETREEANNISRTILLEAIQRCASEQAESSTTSVVSLPSDEMKGRLIGREGRNIRAFEAATGVDLIVDDTPEAVTISAFNIYRREIARLVLKRLISDGRIHPGRIEEVVEKVKAEMEEETLKVGKEAALSLGIHKINPELLRMLGRLKYRTSYGQNVLEHSIEVAHLAGTMAGELKLDQTMAKRAGLLHDIGKSVDQEMEGDHLEIGYEIASRYDESKEVLEAIRGHHDDFRPTAPYAVLISAADALSASRPGARRETLEGYIKRLEKLEAIATGFRGVNQAYAISAGREVRVIVKPEAMSDDEASLLARQISGKIEEGLEYPGTIKVTVIREARYSEMAK
ncbi:MAG TPA: ribonuclease Y [bacterium]|uniref:Ribonuclease Y n=1 Tax=candidate division TA06 bacterium ADurb.Bin417 TaxID=1852828 RepID=A0A1V5MHZ1_UNCT6|nr:MAG: Ribonuclease Y [candidate division TA06 bacterium ADurb.Bin417]HNQ34439.1 ribonuclease Y [bacterium]HNS48151.1 ribonuclease Y [bacterium]